MRQIQALKGVATKIDREGPAIVIINASTTAGPALLRDSGSGGGISGIVSATDVLIGFDRSPSAGSYDAIAPAYAITTIPVPDAVRTIHIIAASASTGSPAGMSHYFSTPDGVPLLIDWADCPVAGSIVPFSGLLPTYPQVGLMRHFLDSWGGIHPPHPSHPILDLGVGSNRQIMQRPMIAPSAVDNIHAVTAINTLFTFGSFLVGVTGSRLVHRIYVSTSVDTLFVIGTAGLTVGSPGSEEVWRGLLKAAAAPQVIEFGEGLETDRGPAGAWRAYTAVAAVLEATVIGG